VRLFAAAELPGEVRAALAGWGAAVGDPRLRPVGEDSLHVTLVFLGEQPDDAAARLGAAVVACAEGPVRAGLGDPVWLSPGRPHVLAVGLTDPDGALGALRARAVAALGVADERRPFLPHVTVARVRRGERIRPAHETLPPVPPLSFGIAALALLRSHLGRGPARYEAVAHAVLPSAGPG
jgi:2'-5' RNA ligase